MPKEYSVGPPQHLTMTRHGSTGRSTVCIDATGGLPFTKQKGFGTDSTKDDDDPVLAC